MHNIDPSGLDAVITQNGNNITVSLTIGIYGYYANQALAMKWQNAINDYWNNHGNNYTIGKCKVNFDAKVLVNPDPNNVMNIAIVLSAASSGPGGSDGDVVPLNPYKHTMNNGIPFVRNSKAGYFYRNGVYSVDSTIAHEAGHFMHLGDHYNINTFGWEFSLMGDQWNVNAASIRDVTAVLANNGALSKCACNQ